MGWKDDVEDRNMVELLTTIFLIIRWYSAYQRWQMLSKEIMKTKYKDCIDRMIKIVEEDDDNDDWFPTAPVLFQSLKHDIKAHFIHYQE